MLSTSITSAHNLAVLYLHSLPLHKEHNRKQSLPIDPTHLLGYAPGVPAEAHIWSSLQFFPLTLEASARTQKQIC